MTYKFGEGPVAVEGGYAARSSSLAGVLGPRDIEEHPEAIAVVARGDHGWALGVVLLEFESGEKFGEFYQTQDPVDVAIFMPSIGVSTFFVPVNRDSEKVRLRNWDCEIPKKTEAMTYLYWVTSTKSDIVVGFLLSLIPLDGTKIHEITHLCSSMWKFTKWVSLDGRGAWTPDGK